MINDLIGSFMISFKIQVSTAFLTKERITPQLKLAKKPNNSFLVHISSFKGSSSISHEHYCQQCRYGICKRNKMKQYCWQTIFIECSTTLSHLFGINQEKVHDFARVMEILLVLWHYLTSCNPRFIPATISLTLTVFCPASFLASQVYSP